MKKQKLLQKKPLRNSIQLVRYVLSNYILYFNRIFIFLLNTIFISINRKRYQKSIKINNIWGPFINKSMVSYLWLDHLSSNSFNWLLDETILLRALSQ